MKHSIKKFISLMLVLAISFVVAVPAFAAEKGVSPQKQVLAANSNSISGITVKASGKTYGPWFGYREETFSSQGNVQVGVFVTGVLLATLAPQLGATVAGSITTGFAATLTGVAFILPDDYVYGTIYKQQREVFINGEFAYFQSDRTVKAYMYRNHQTTYLGIVTKYIDGDSPAVKQD